MASKCLGKLIKNVFSNTIIYTFEWFMYLCYVTLFSGKNEHTTKSCHGRFYIGII